MTVKEKTCKPEDLSSISKRLKHIIDSLGVKQSHMATKLGLSASGLHYILNNEVKFSKNAKKLARHLKINEEWLQTGKGKAYNTSEENEIYKIPIFYTDQLKLYYFTNKTIDMQTNNFILTNSVYHNKTISVFITETDFSPKFEIGDMVAFEEEEDIYNGEIILVYLAKPNSIVIKKWHSLGNEIVLLSNNQQPIQFDRNNGDIIIGAYRECIKKQKTRNNKRNKYG